MEHFIIVFSEREKNALLEIGYVLLKSDERNHIYTFENRKDLYFDKSKIYAAFSNVLTF